MSLHELTMEIHAHWGDKPPAYRIYVNDDLLTERTFNYPGNTTYIREHIVVDLAPGSHFIQLIQLDTDNTTATITEKNIFHNGSPLQSIVNGSRHHFTVSE
jgi:hypothetical protein